MYYKLGDFYYYLKAVNELLVVELSEPYNIYIEKFGVSDFTLIRPYAETITHAQFYSVLFESIEHLKQFLPDKNKDIFEGDGCADFTQDHDYEDESLDKEWWSHRKVVE